MPFNIRMGLPEMDAVWTDLSTRSQAGELNKDEQKSLHQVVQVSRCQTQVGWEGLTMVQHPVSSFRPPFPAPRSTDALENLSPAVVVRISALPGKDTARDTFGSARRLNSPRERVWRKPEGMVAFSATVRTRDRDGTWPNSTRSLRSSPRFSLGVLPCLGYFFHGYDGQRPNKGCHSARAYAFGLIQPL
jgi:hypothetical protein